MKKKDPPKKGEGTERGKGVFFIKKRGRENTERLFVKRKRGLKGKRERNAIIFREKKERLVLCYKS